MQEKITHPSTLTSPWAKPGDGASPPSDSAASHSETAEVERTDDITADGAPLRRLQSGERRMHFGDYVLLEEIARGGMGVVYRARQVSLNRIVAVKVARGDDSGSMSDSKRFHFEAEATARLDHPNIVPIHEVGEINGRAFFSMALVEGKSLAEKIVVDPMPAKAAARLMAQVADAVAYAHAQGVVHRDLKPANILLDEKGQPRITDFGLAKIVDTNSSITRAGEVLGTPNYMPPEQAAGRNDEVGTLSDVYSLGATLYALITGRPPFQSATVLETLNQVLFRDPIPPRTLNPAVDRDLDTICLKCIAKRPDQRYATATAFADDLRRFLNGNSIVARPVGHAEKVIRWCRRNLLAAAALFAMAGIFLIAFVLISWSYYRVEDALKKEAAQRAQAQGREKSERWERYRSNLAGAASALRLHNVNAARQALDAAPEEYRNWEWRHFYGQLDLSKQTYLPGDGPARHSSVATALGHVVTVTLGQPLRYWDPFCQEVSQSTNLEAGPFGYMFSADGKRFVSKPNPEEIDVFDVASGTLVSKFKLDDREITGWALSDDNSRFATSSPDTTVKIWDVASGKRLFVLRGHKLTAGRLEFSKDGRLLASSGNYDSTARVWDTRNGKLLAVLPFPSANVIAAKFSADGERCLLYAGYPTTDLLLFESRSGRLVAKLNGHTNQISGAEFNSDGKLIASASYDQDLRLWDSRDGKQIFVLRGHKGRVTRVQFSPDKKRLLSASNDKTLRIWDVATGESLAVLHGHNQEIRDASYSADGSEIVSICQGNTIRVWDTQAAERDGRFRGHRNFAYDVAFTPDGRKAASVSWDGTARIWDVANGKEILTIHYPSPALVLSLAIHPCAELLATVGRDSAVRFWDMTTGRQLHSCAMNTGTWKDPRIAFNRKGDRLAAGSQDRGVHLWDVTFRSATEPADRSLTVANERVFRGHRDCVRDVVFDPNDKWLASAGDDGDRTIRVWNVDTGEELRTLTLQTDSVYCLAVSRDGKLLASGSVDGTVRIWDTSTWASVAVISLRTAVHGLSFSADGSRLASACADNTIRMLDLATFQEVAELHGHDSYVHRVAFSPDCTRLISASGDFTLKLWQSIPANSPP